MTGRVTCGECRHYLPDPSFVGTCKRFPPTVFAEGRQALPILLPADWCGEAAKEEPST